MEMKRNPFEGWHLTHEIIWHPTHGKKQRTYVMLHEGRGYTRQEWQDCEHSDWELVNGAWLFQGQTTPGGANGEVRVRYYGPRKRS